MQEEFQADSRHLDGPTPNSREIKKLNGPPKATLARRAQSYSDFHDAVKAVLGPANGVRVEAAQDCRPRSRDSSQLKSGASTIQSELEFTGWYDEFEHQLLDASHNDYTSYQRELQISHSHLNSLLSDTASTLSLLSSLTGSFKEVEAQTTIFQKQCEGLLDEQKRIEGLTEKLDHNLKYYNYLEPVTRRLNAPGAGNFVRSQEFSEMLSRLDECLGYMAAHVSPTTDIGTKHLTGAIAEPPRNLNICISLPFANDKRADIGSSSFRWCTSRNSI